MTVLTRLILRRRLRVPPATQDTGYWTIFSRVIVGANFFYSKFHGTMQKVSETWGIFNTNEGLDYKSFQPEDPVMVYDVEDVEPYPELPEGLFFRRCVIMARCRVCERDYEWYADPEEYTDEYSYCGGSPSCIP